MGKEQIGKARELYDAKIQFVSLVDAAANKRKFLMTKAKDGTCSFVNYGRILKADDASHWDRLQKGEITGFSMGGICMSSNLEGDYTYTNVPREVFQRHDHCKCTVDYEGRKLKAYESGGKAHTFRAEEKPGAKDKSKR